MTPETDNCAMFLDRERCRLRPKLRCISGERHRCKPSPSNHGLNNYKVHDTDALYQSLRIYSIDRIHGYRLPSVLKCVFRYMSFFQQYYVCKMPHPKPPSP